MNEQPDKAVTKTVSMPESLWAAIDGHSVADGEDRSSYLRRLARADLQAAGKLPGSPLAEISDLARSTAELVGADRVKAMLQRLGTDRLATTAAKAA